MTKFFCIAVIAAALFLATCAFAQAEDGVISPTPDVQVAQVTQVDENVAPPAPPAQVIPVQPVEQTRAGMEEATRLILSGEVTVHADGSMTRNRVAKAPRRHGVSSRTVNRKVAAAEKRCNARADKGDVAAKWYAFNWIQSVTRDVKTWKDDIQSQISAINAKANWALVISIIALILALVAILRRTGVILPRPRYSP